MTAVLAMKSSRLMDLGKRQAAGGHWTLGTQKNGMCWHADPMAYQWPACSCTTAGRMIGNSRLFMTECADYVELHSASAFSFLEGASQPEDLIDQALARGIPAIALTDRNGVYGIARFHTAAVRKKIKAHIGAEIAVSSFGSRLTPRPWLPHQYPKEPPRLTLLCTSQAGYQNLCQLITRFKMREPTKAEGAATLEDLEEFASGLICLTGGEEGPLAAALTREGRSRVRDNLESLTSIFGRGNVYLEIQRHQLRDEEQRNQALMEISSSLHLPVIATNGVRHALEKDREVFDVLTSIRHHCSLDQAGRLLARNNARHLRTPEEMRALFDDIPEAIANT